MEDKDVTERLIAVEKDVEHIKDDVSVLQSQVGVLHRDLRKLIALTSNIKWWLTGVGSLYVAEQIGVLPFFKKLIGL